MGIRRKGMWGGPRKGAGRKPGFGGPRHAIRSCRVVVMLTEGEFQKLKKLALTKDIPVGTAAYEFVARGLKRRK